MADPLSIAASACGIANMCGTVIVKVSKFVIDTRALPRTLKDFTTIIKSLQTVLENIDATVIKRPKQLPFAHKQERKHWRDIKNVLEACNDCVYKLNKELPEVRENASQSFMADARTQISMTLNSNVVLQIRGHIASYTQILQLSLTTITLGSMWETQKSQESLRTEIQKLTEEIRQTNLARQRRQHEPGYQTSNPDPGQDLTLVEMLANRNIDEWRESAESLAAAVTLYDPDDQSVADRADDQSVWSGSNLPALNENRRAEIGDRIGSLRRIEEGAGIIAHPDSGFALSETDSDFDPEPDNLYVLGVEILKLQIKANLENVDKLLSNGLFVQAEHYQKKGIELREQLEKTHGIPFLDRADAEEKMADIFIRQKDTTNALAQAKIILQRLLNQEVSRELTPNDDRIRCWRLYHKLAFVYIELKNFKKAKEFAIRALEGKMKLSPMPKDLVLETANLLVRAYQLSQEFDKVLGLKDWISHQNLQPRIIDKPDFILPDAIEWCRDTGFDVDSLDFHFDTPNAEGKTPLHVAVSMQKTDIVQQMIDHLTNLETRDRDSCTALLLAAATRNRRTTEALLKHGARVDVYDKDLNTPLHRVQVADGGIMVAKLLLNSRVDINQKNSYDQTPLYLACEMGNEKMVELLLRSKADVNCRGPGDCTPLHVAIDYRRLAIVKRLLDSGADITLRDAAGRNAVKAGKTTRQGSQDIQRLLQEREKSLQIAERHRLLSQPRNVSTDDSHSAHSRRAESMGSARRDTAASNMSSVSTASNRSIGSNTSKTKAAKFGFGFRRSRDDTNK